MPSNQLEFVTHMGFLTFSLITTLCTLYLYQRVQRPSLLNQLLLGWTLLVITMYVVVRHYTQHEHDRCVFYQPCCASQVLWKVGHTGVFVWSFSLLVALAVPPSHQLLKILLLGGMSLRLLYLWLLP